MKFLIAGALALLLWPVLPLMASGQSESGVELKQLARDVYAVITDDGAGNGAVIIGQDEILVIDTQVVPALAEAVIAEIQAISNLPVTRVLNTHWHIDHSHGNVAYRTAFGDRVEFWAHASVPEDMAERAADQLALWPDFYGQSVEGLDRLIAAGTTADGTQLGEATVNWMKRSLAKKQRYLHEMQARPRLVLPNRTVRADTSMSVGGIQVRIIVAPGHTNGGLVVYLPESKVLVAGDLILQHIFVQDATPRQFLASLRAIEGLDISQIVPGHGPLFQGVNAIQERRAALEAAIGHAESAVSAGHTLQEALDALDRDALSRFIPQLDALVTEAYENSTR